MEQSLEIVLFSVVTDRFVAVKNAWLTAKSEHFFRHIVRSRRSGTIILSLDGQLLLHHNRTEQEEQMSLAEDGCKPVIKAPGDDESEDRFASQEEKSRDIHNSGKVCSESAGVDGRLSDVVAADDDPEAIRGAQESPKMEKETEPSIYRKKSSKVALLNVPCCESHPKGLDNPAVCTDVEPPTGFPENDADTAPNYTNRVCDPSEIKNLRGNGEDRRCIILYPSDSGEEKEICGGFPENSDFADSEEKGNARDSEERKEIFENDTTESNTPKIVNKSLELNGPHENPNQNKDAGKEDKEKKKTWDIKMNIPEEDEDTICGIGSFRPKWLQQYATPRCYLVLYSIIGILQGSYYAYLIGTISTLERRFAFKSKISGVIMIIDEITPLILGIFVGYFGGKAHRPRMVAFGMFLSTLCCLFSAMPFFIYGPAQHLVYSNSTGPQVCDMQQKMEECDEDDRPPTLAAVVFLILGSFLKGFGNLAYYAIGLAYMDDNAEKKNTPIYFGVSFALRLLGPTSGFLMSSAFLKIYENPFEDPGFGREDPRWIGAWWMGFVLQGGLLLIFTFPIMLFPRRLPSQKKPNPRDQSSFEHEGLVQKIKGLLVGLKRLSTNEIYVYLSIETIFSILGGFGHYMMLPKYMENQFRLSASDASLYSGPPGLVALQISTILGSILIWKYRMNARTLMAGKITTETLGIILFLIMMIPSCPNINFAGTTAVSKGLELQNECNKDCLCTANVFTPLCGPDGVSTYFSSCHAGCSASLPEDDVYGPEVFANCSCVHDANGSFITVEKMTKGFCPDESCWTQAVFYIILLPIIDGVTSIFRVGHTMILLRCIDPQDKSFALGTFETMLCLFGFIPYPVIYGALADSVCLIWEFSCGATGNCWVYDMQKFNFLLHGVCAAFCFAAALCDIRILSMSHKIRDLYKEDHDDPSEKQHQTKKQADDSDLIKRSKESVESTNL